MPDLSSLTPVAIGIVAILAAYWLIKCLIRMVKRLMIRVGVIVLLLIAYPALRGPLTWLTDEGYLPKQVTQFLDRVYIPLDRVKEVAATIHDTLGEYEYLWRR